MARLVPEEASPYPKPDKIINSTDHHCFYIDEFLDAIMGLTLIIGFLLILSPAFVPSLEPFHKVLLASP